MKTIDYYFAPQSPFARLGHERLRAIATRHGATVVPRPIDLGRVFPATGGLPLPKRAPERQAYRLVEIERWARHRGVPMNPQPRCFPVDGNPASLLILAARETAGNEAAMDLAGAFMQAVWADELDIADAATQRALVARAGLDFDALAALAPAMQATYEAETAQAVARGVFGAPWYQAGPDAADGYWGQDRLELLEAALAG